MRLKNIIGIAMLTSVVGCVSTQDIVTPPVAAQFSSAEAQNSVVKYVNLPSRTFAFDAKNKKTELTGANCTTSGVGFTLSYTTPANLQVPTFGTRTSDLTMTCSYNEATRSKSIKVVNLTSQSISNAGAGGGLIGAVIASGVAGVRGNRENDNFSYENLFLDMNSKR